MHTIYNITLFIVFSSYFWRLPFGDQHSVVGDIATDIVMPIVAEHFFKIYEKSVRNVS